MSKSSDGKNTVRVLVPRYLFRHCLDELARQGFMPAPTTAEFNGLKFKAYSIDLAINTEESFDRSLKALAPLAPKGLPTETKFQPIEVTCDGRVMHCMVKDRPDLVKVDANARRDFPADAKRQENARLAKPAYEAQLARFCGLTGIKAKMMVAKYANYDPLPEVQGEINLIVNASPTGRAVSVHRLSLFGLRICNDNEMAPCHLPARGRGPVMMDPDGKEAVQLIGNTAYLLCPLFGPYYGSTSERIFWNLLALAWQGMTQPAETGEAEEDDAETADQSTLSKRQFVEAGQYGLRNWILYLEGEIDERRQDVIKFLEALAVRRRNIWELQSILDGVQKVTRTAKSRLSKDYDRLRALPEIESISVVDEGLHFRTGPIAVEHQGQRYATSRNFVIRLDFHGDKLTVWGEQPFHPHGHSHPHLERDQTPCYGNAGIALHEAMAEWRVFDAVNLALRWLKQGYAPELARHPVEEWPLAGEDGLPLPLDQQSPEYLKQLMTALATRPAAVAKDIDWAALLETERGQEAFVKMVGKARGQLQKIGEFMGVDLSAINDQLDDKVIRQGIMALAVLNGLGVEADSPEGRDALTKLEARYAADDEVQDGPMDGAEAAEADGDAEGVAEEGQEAADV